MLIAGLALAATKTYDDGKQTVEKGADLKFVSGTEYWSGETGQMIVRLLDWKKEPFLNAQCVGTILFPNKTVWRSKMPLAATNSGATPGNYYMNFTTPQAEGVYEELAECEYTPGNKMTISSAFHVAVPLNFLKTINENLVSTNVSLDDAKVTFLAQLEATNQTLYNQVVLQGTNTRDLVNAANTSLYNTVRDAQQQLFDGLTSTNATLNDARVVITGRLSDTNQSISTLVTREAINTRDLLNAVNLSVADKLRDYNASLDTHLSNVNVDIDARVGSTNESLHARLTDVNGSLDALMKNVNSTLASYLDAYFADLFVRLGNVNATIHAKLDAANLSITTSVVTESTNTRNLVNLVHNALATQLVQSNQSVQDRLDLLEIDLTGLINVTSTNNANTTLVLSEQLTRTNQSLSQFIGDFNNSLRDYLNGEITDLRNRIIDLKSTTLSVNATINTRIAETGQSLSLQLTQTNSSVIAFTGAFNESLRTYMDGELADLRNRLINIYGDTQWIRNNAMNQDNAAIINEKQSRILGNLSLVEQFCNTTETSGSKLCVQLNEIQAFQRETNATYTAYFNKIDTTTVNTYDFLTTTVYSSLNNIFAGVQEINATTRQINDTVTAIRNNQESEVYGQMLS